ncbi:MAG: hypothetical protein IPJ34_29715 [Myxococcales bacterium]|nr:hypothetical protein [Myxococcales bacterium]
MRHALALSSLTLGLLVGCSDPAVAPAETDTGLDTGTATDSTLDTTADTGDAAPDSRTDTSGDGATDTKTDTGLDGATDTSVDAPPPPLPSCLGETRATVISSGLPFTDVSVGTSPSKVTGKFLLDLATTGSTIDLGAFTGTKPTASGCNPALLGQSCKFTDLDFFGSWGMVTLRTADHSGITGSVREAGILGTDFFSVLALTLDYTGKRVHRTTKASLCDDATLAGAGFSPLSSAGFYSNDFGKLKPLTAVDAAAPTGVTVANVPTVPLWVAGVRADAQLDTGFDDGLVPFSINVNQAFFDAIKAKSPTALVRDSSRDLVLSTCVGGLSEPVEAYTLSAGNAAELRTEAGVAAHSYPKAVLFVKRTPVGAKVCGGIGTWTAPAAQVAASIFLDAGAILFDPFSSRVWMR